MDSAVVGSVYRGNGLQEQMLEAAESLLDKEKYYYLMCTIHPDNEFSIKINEINKKQLVKFL